MKVDILERKDICICPWTEYTVSPTYLYTCTWNSTTFFKLLGDPFAAGPWAGDVSFSEPVVMEQRRKMLDFGKMCCPETCPLKHSDLTVGQQFERFRMDERATGIIDALISNMRSGNFRPSKPLSVVLVPTLLCNQKCSFCCQDLDLLIEQGCQLKATPEQLRHIQTVYDDCYIFRTTGGDTFASSDEDIEMMYAPFTGRKAYKIVNTNMRGLTLERYEKFFIEKDMINDITMSLATLNPERYRQLYSGSDLEPIVKNITDIATKYPDHKINSLALVVMSTNFRDIPDMLAFATKYRIGGILLLPLHTWQLQKRGLMSLDLLGEGFSEERYQEFQEMKIRLAEVRKVSDVRFSGLDYIDAALEARRRG